MYIGRFAPSPTGELHFGSLLAALASFLDAKKNGGLWLLRIDDIDPAREKAGAAHHIIDTLSNYGLQWDREITFQSQCQHYYQAALKQLQQAQLCYQCQCSRKQIMDRTGSNRYDRYCLKQPSKTIDYPSAWRYKFTQSEICWHDQIQGQQTLCSGHLNDFILKRKEGLWAYQLAVAVDDARCGITHIVRGADLLPEAANQLSLIQSLHFNDITFAHIPVIKNSNGQKLSKQNLATPLTTDKISHNLCLALTLLGQKVDKKFCNAHKDDILQQAIVNWDLSKVPLEYATYFK